MAIFRVHEDRPLGSFRASFFIPLPVEWRVVETFLSSSIRSKMCISSSKWVIYVDVTALGHFSRLLRRRGWVLVIDVGMKLQRGQAREAEQCARRNDGAARGIATYSVNLRYTFIISPLFPFISASPFFRFSARFLYYILLSRLFICFFLLSPLFSFCLHSVWHR